MGAYTGLDYGIDPEHVGRTIDRYGQATYELRMAMEQGAISENTLETMHQYIGRDGVDAHEEMMARGHNAEGMPIDAETRIEQPAPLYYSQSRKEYLPLSRSCCCCAV